MNPITTIDQEALFFQRQTPCLLVLLALSIPMFIAVIMMGRWSAIMRSIEMALSLVTCAVLAWTVPDGPVFIAPSSDPTVKFVLVLIFAFTLTNMAINRQAKSGPDDSIHAFTQSFESASAPKGLSAAGVSRFCRRRHSIVLRLLAATQLAQRGAVEAQAGGGEKHFAQEQR